MVAGGGVSRGGLPLLSIIIGRDFKHYCLHSIIAYIYSTWYLVMSEYIRYLARIHAHICGDGHIYTEKGNYGLRYVIEYTNKELSLINDFAFSIYKLLGKYPTIIRRSSKNVIVARIKSKNLYEKLGALGAGKSREWRIPQTFTNNSNIFLEWLSAFIDDEAYIDTDKNRIIINSVNKNGLNQICNTLKTNGYTCKLYNYTNHDTTRLIIPQRKNTCKLAHKLKLANTTKKNKLRQICTNKERWETAPF